MNPIVFYPLRFDPIYQYRLWGGRRLAKMLAAPLPDDSPIGEAWLLSDRDDHPSRVADGPLHGRTLGQLFKESPEQMLGKLAGRFRRFPLLLKFLDVRTLLSVQVHPSDRQTDYLPPGETGKTEAWVVLEVGLEGRIYAGLKPGATANELRRAIAARTVAEHLASFSPKLGDGVLVPAGTVHALGDVVVFEVQENSDVTFRLYDWDHIDAKIGQPRPLQVDQALACVDFGQGAIGPVTPVLEKSTPVRRELLFCCEHFGLSRLSARPALSAGDEVRAAGEGQFVVGAAATPRVLVCIAGEGHLEHAGTDYVVARGDVYLLPAAVGACGCRTSGTITLLDISLPEGNTKK